MNIFSAIKNIFSKRLPKKGELWVGIFQTEHEAIFEIVDVKKGYAFYKYPYLSNSKIHSMMVQSLAGSARFVAKSKSDWEATDQ